MLSRSSALMIDISGLRLTLVSGCASSGISVGNLVCSTVHGQLCFGIGVVVHDTEVPLQQHFCMVLPFSGAIVTDAEVIGASPITIHKAKTTIGLTIEISQYFIFLIIAPLNRERLLLFHVFSILLLFNKIRSILS